jgi:catechol 2,3-dioxygenase-like lactoylglutathione lyase family enzyme
MRVQGINHVSINVRDLEVSARFYAEVLGFRRLETVAMDGGFSITYFEIPGGGRMELFDHSGGSRESHREESEVGLRHLAFTVEDVVGAEKLLRARDVPIVLPTTEVPALGARVLLFLDPNGVTLEFCEALAA